MAQGLSDVKHLFETMDIKDNKQQITLLLLGETGVGKSTFINAFVNYLLYERMSDAVNRSLCLIPTKFSLTDPKTKKRKVMTFGTPSAYENTDKTTESATKYPQCYPFDIDEYRLNIIDTPGIVDTKGLDKDNQNMQNILNFISHYNTIDAICVLLKPNEARVGVIFKYCILELLSNLNRSAANNILFIFTNARGTFYQPGDTAVSLEEVLTQVKQRPPNVEIKFDENNTFCFDNESFRYLVAVSEPNNMVFNKCVSDDYEKSWNNSVNECKRLMDYIIHMKPHNVMDTLSLNRSKRTIKLLTKPMADISKNIAENIKECELRTEKILQFDGNIRELERELYIPVIEIKSTPLKKPKTVCSDIKCCDYENIDGQVVKHYRQTCHYPCYLNFDDGRVVGTKALLDCKSFNKYKQNGPDEYVRPEDANLYPDNSYDADPQTGLMIVHSCTRKQLDNCLVCKHSFKTHLHVKYETKKVKSKRRDEAKCEMINTEERAKKAHQDMINDLMDRQNMLKKEIKIITECMAQFAVFLKNNALTPFNDAYEEYVEYLIKVEEHKESLIPGFSKQSIQQLRDLLDQYHHEKDVILRSMKIGDKNHKSITLEDIDNCVNKLCRLPISGQTIRDHLDMQLKINNNLHNEKMHQIYKIVKFYLRVFQLPPGPLPIPIFGNLLALRGTKDHFVYELRKYSKKYGDVFTFWLGTNPFIFIADLDIARETFRKNEFIDRPESFFAKSISNKNYSDVAFDNYGHRWEALRRVTHAAVLSYAKTDKLAYLVSDCVENTIKTIVKREGLNKPFYPYPYIYHMFSNILATSAFSRGYDLEDKEYLFFKYAFKDLGEEMGIRLALWEVSPLIRFLDKKKVKEVIGVTIGTIDVIKDKFKSHYNNYDPNVCRDFCDALITAKNDALRDAKESAPYLTDENLAMSIWDLFIAGTDTSQNTFQWIILLMTYYPEMQQKLRQEISDEIGDRMATHEDKHRCHYTMAFISEIMRYRNSVPNGLFHGTAVNTQFGEYNLPKKTALFVNQWEIMNSEKYWENADKFLPERFLDSEGQHMTTRPKAYIPFGVGRRVCLGEKLAIADLFLVLVRFLQLTENYDIVLSDYKDLDPNPNDANAFMPNKHQIEFKIKTNK